MIKIKYSTYYNVAPCPDVRPSGGLYAPDISTAERGFCVGGGGGGKAREARNCVLVKSGQIANPIIAMDLRIY